MSLETSPGPKRNSYLWGHSGSRVALPPSTDQTRG
jgi:hypothetical protein